MAGGEFSALVVDKTGDEVAVGLRRLTVDDLMPGEVTIRVAYSSVNYKDGLVARANGRVARRYPLVPGIDLAGVVLDSTDARFRPGEPVMAQGYDIGVAHHGGMAEVARIPAAWVMPLPEGLSAREAMAIGTAGYTAAVSVEKLERFGVRPDGGPVIVTGATGGVGSVAVDILGARGYHVVASTGKESSHPYLRQIGAAEIISREETSADGTKPLEHMRWAAAVDTVGGATFAYLLRTMRYGGVIAISGDPGGVQVSTTVFPFILRAVSVLGIDSVQVPLDVRAATWKRLASDLRPRHLSEITMEVRLEGAPAAIEAIKRGALRGRTIVALDA